MRDIQPNGSAIMSAIVIVSIAAILVSSSFFISLSTILRVESQRDISQANWISLALVDYSRWILTADLNGSKGFYSQIDHLSEPWAQRIPFSKLDKLFGGQLDESDRVLFSLTGFEGYILDEQGKLNIAGLTDKNSKQQWLKSSLKNLFVVLNIEDSKFSLFYDLLSKSKKKENLYNGYRYKKLNDLVENLELPDEVKKKLLDKIVWLPEPTPVNINTAPIEVIASIFHEKDLSKLDFLIETKKKYPFRSVAEISSTYNFNTSELNGLISNKSNYFSVSGYVQFNNAEKEFFTMLKRDNSKVFVIYEEEV